MGCLDFVCKKEPQETERLSGTKIVSECGLKISNKIWKLSMLLCFIGLILYIIAFSTQYWGQIDNKRSETVPGAVLDAHNGLWKECATLTDRGTGEILRQACQRVDNGEAYKPAAKVLCTAGLIGALLGISLCLLAGWYSNSRLMVLGGFFVIVAGVIAAVGSAVFIGKSKDLDSRLDPGYSAYFAIIGCAIIILGGGFEIVSLRTGYETITE